MYISYWSSPVLLAKKKIGFRKDSNESPEHKFLDKVFQFTRTGNRKTFENAFSVSLNDFCDALEIK